MLQRRAKISPNFSMASMTDVIFLLLIFFMITSTVVSPNAIKVLLPQGKQQTSAKPLTRVLQRRAKISPNFSMASMTDVIFLLLIFFMITSTVVSPNAIKVLLPQGKQQTSAKPLTRVIIDKDLNYYAAFGNDKEQALALDELTPFLQSCAAKEPEMYVALYADESVPYREIVKVLNIANENHFKMVLATRPPENK